MVKFPKVDQKKRQSWCSRNKESGCKSLQNIYMFNLLNSWFDELQISLNRQKAPAHWINAPKKMIDRVRLNHYVVTSTSGETQQLLNRSGVRWEVCCIRFLAACSHKVDNHLHSELYCRKKNPPTVTQYYRGIASTPHLLLKPCPLVNSTEQREFATRNNCMPVTLQTSPIAFWAEQTKEEQVDTAGRSWDNVSTVYSLVTRELLQTCSVFFPRIRKVINIH